MIFFFKILRDDLEDIRKEIEKEEEHIHTGPLKTKSEVSVKVHSISSSLFVFCLSIHSFVCLFVCLCVHLLKTLKIKIEMVMESVKKIQKQRCKQVYLKASNHGV